MPPPVPPHHPWAPSAHYPVAAPPRRSPRWPWAVVVVALLLAGGTSWAALATASPGRATPAPVPAAVSGPAATAPAPRAVRIVENLPLLSANGAAIDPTGSRFYVTGIDEESYEEGQVQVYDLGSDTPVGSVALTHSTGEYITGLTPAPDGRRLYASTTSYAPGGATTAGLAVVDPAGPTLLGTVPLSDTPGPIAVAPDGSRVYIGVSTGVEVVDPVAGRSLGTIPVGGRVSGMAVTKEGWLLIAAPSGLKVVDPAAGAVLSTIDLQGYPTEVAITPDNRYALVTMQNKNTLVQVDLAKKTATGTVEVGEGPTTVVVTPDGRQALVANTDAGSVSTVDLATGASTELNVGRRPETIAVSPNGRDVLVLTSENLVRLERAGG